MTWLIANWKSLARLALGLVVAYFVWQYNLGQRARVEVDALKTQIETIRAQEKVRIQTFDAEITRLTTQAERDKQTEKLQDEANRDPTAAAPAIGLRSVNRINSDR